MNAQDRAEIEMECETLLQSSHREWIEDREQELQRRDEQAVVRFLAGRLKQRDKSMPEKLKARLRDS